MKLSLGLRIALVAALAYLLLVGACRKESPCPASTDGKGRDRRGEAHPANALPLGVDRPRQAPGTDEPAARETPAEPPSAVGRQQQAASAPAERETASQPSDNSDTCIAAGLQAFRHGRNAEAVDRFYKAFEMDPARLDALRCMCEALVADERYDQAAEIYEMIVEMDRHDHLSRFNLAVIYTRLGRFTDAEAAYNALLADRGDYIRARYNLAVLQQAQGKLADAAETWQKVIRCDHELPSAHASLGQVYLDLGDVEAAMAHYAEAAKLRPREVGGWINLAAASRAAGFLGRAHVAMQRAVDLAPEDADLWRQLGQLQLDLHRSTGRRELLDRACASWRKSLALDPNQPELRDWLKTYRSSAPTSRDSNGAGQPATRSCTPPDGSSSPGR